MGKMFSCYLGDAVTQSANDDYVLLPLLRGFCSTDRSEHGFFVKWFDRTDIDHLCTDAFFFQDNAGFISFPNHVAACKDGHVCAF